MDGFGKIEHNRPNGLLLYPIIIYNLPGLRFFVYCGCIIMRFSHLNDKEIPETKSFISRSGFELGASLS